jgi:hypothetical protein
MAKAPKTKFELFVELVQAMAWPLSATIVVFSFWTPLQDAARQIPSIVGRSDTITIAGLSLKVGQGLRQKASDAVKRVLDKLSPEGVKKILSMSQGSYWDKGNEYDGRNENSELVKLGLVDEVPANELDQKNGLEHKNFGYGIRPTQLGRETQSFLQSVVSEFVQQLGYAAQGEPDKK